ncbi:hypothetical protein ACCD06_02460 [Azospirillum sp. CT11-132]|uniref:hypothetical protein n=1 Tax=unclassified Azospirillum TaxID=2630922 RepID=UPI001304CAC3|nr:MULTISPECIES: hypothetical protein [unclassified Azospirillum]
MSAVQSADLATCFVERDPQVALAAFLVTSIVYPKRSLSLGGAVPNTVKGEAS